MSNMAYCRFRNTVTDLADCVEWAEMDANLTGLSKEEIEAVHRLYELCKRFISAWDYSHG